MVNLLHEHNGSFNAVREDKRSPVKGNSPIYYYKRKYKLLDRLGEYRRKLLEEYKKQSIEILGQAKKRVIERAIGLLESRTIDFVTKKGEKIEINVEPNHKEIEVAWKIIKSELGEPTVIKETKDDPEAVNKLKNAKQINIIVHKTDGSTDNQPISA